MKENPNTHVLNNAFKTEANATGWNLYNLMKHIFKYYMTHHQEEKIISPPLIQVFSFFTLV